MRQSKRRRHRANAKGTNRWRQETAMFDDAIAQRDDAKDDRKAKAYFMNNRAPQHSAER